MASGPGGHQTSSALESGPSSSRSHQFFGAGFIQRGHPGVSVEVRRRLADRWPTTWARADEPRLCVVRRPEEYRPPFIGSSPHGEFRPVKARISQSITLTLVAVFVTDPRSTFQSFDTAIETDANGFFALDFVPFCGIHRVGLVQPEPVVHRIERAEGLVSVFVANTELTPIKLSVETARALHRLARRNFALFHAYSPRCVGTSRYSSKARGCDEQDSAAIDAGDGGVYGGSRRGATCTSRGNSGDQRDRAARRTTRSTGDNSDRILPAFRVRRR